MLKCIFIACIFLVAYLVSSAQTSSSFDKLAFLNGRWSIETDKGRIVEFWNQVNDSQLEGISYSISHTGDSTLLETVKLQELDGDIFSFLQDLVKEIIPL